MSRVAKKPITLPSGVEVHLDGRELAVKGPKGNLSLLLHKAVSVQQEGQMLQVAPLNASGAADAQAGTARAVLNNMVVGVTRGFEKKLELVGVGYRAQAQGKVLNLTLGYSHPIHFQVPDGISIDTPSQTEILVRGIDRCLVGQVAATIRGYRPPEPYKGKGAKYANEKIKRKEAKKK